MRVIKLAVISVIILFLLVTGISLLIPSHIRISRATDIRGQKDSIFSLLENKENWPLWHPAFDPANNKIPTIESHIISRNDSAISIGMWQSGKKEVANTWLLHSYPNSSTFTLQWYMDFYPEWYPWQKVGSLFYEDMYGKMMEEGLMNLKGKMEASPF